MERHCLDADVFIQAKNGPYGFDIAPAFWQILREELRRGSIYSSIWVYKELQRQDDQLAEWARTTKHLGLAVQPSNTAQHYYGAIAAYVVDNFPQQYAEEFLGGADPWVIAQALDDGARIVTQEARAGENTRHPKIPNVARVFNVGCIDTYALLRVLNRRLDGFK